MRVPAAHTQKLDNRSKLVVHFGREPGTKAYRSYDPNSGRIHVSRDVVFDEKKSWDWVQTDNRGAKTEEYFILEGYTSDTPAHSPPDIPTPAHSPPDIPASIEYASTPLRPVANTNICR